MNMTAGRCLVVGLGNPILGDDGVGWLVADEVERELGDSVLQVEVQRASLGGLSLMERLVGFERAIIVDAVHSGRSPSGTVRMFAADELPDPSAGYTTAAHDTSFQTALAVGRRLGAGIPEHITFVTVEISRNYEFSEELTQPVAAAIPSATAVVLDIVTRTTTRERVRHGIP